MRRQRRLRVALLLLVGATLCTTAVHARKPTRRDAVTATAPTIGEGTVDTGSWRYLAATAEPSDWTTPTYSDSDWSDAAPTTTAGSEPSLLLMRRWLAVPTSGHQSTTALLTVTHGQSQTVAAYVQGGMIDTTVPLPVSGSATVTSRLRLSLPRAASGRVVVALRVQGVCLCVCVRECV